MRIKLNVNGNRSILHGRIDTGDYALDDAVVCVD